MPVTNILIVGANGFVGLEVLTLALKNPYLTQIYTLSRQPLPNNLSSHKKVTQLLHPDFNTIPPALYETLRDSGVQACIWAVGKPNLKQYKNLDEARDVLIQLPVKVAEDLAKTCAVPAMEAQGGKFIHPFRFVFVSAWGAERDSNRSLWVWGESRKIKGAAEKALVDIMEASEIVDGKRSFEVTCLRAGTVLRRGKDLGTVIAMGTTPSIAVDLLARRAIGVALDGEVDGKRILENAEIMGPDWADINIINA
nr:hypothetical protein B0A51_12584 [Rachicladosporium sp. CCFEE 5018]